MVLQEEPVRILVVDDDEVYLGILREAVESEQTRVTLASDGVEALDRLRSSATAMDILISDLNMPHMDGLTLIKQARQEYPQLLTIIITGYGSLESAIEAIRMGAYDYVQKPFKLHEIMVTTRNAVEKVKIQRDKARLLQEINSLHQRLHQMEAMKRSEPTEQDSGDEIPQTPYGMLHGHGELLQLIDKPMDKPMENPSRILFALEGLKELKREGIINQLEFSRFTNALLIKMD